MMRCANLAIHSNSEDVTTYMIASGDRVAYISSCQIWLTKAAKSKVAMPIEFTDTMVIKPHLSVLSGIDAHAMHINTLT